MPVPALRPANYLGPSSWCCRPQKSKINGLRLARSAMPLNKEQLWHVMKATALLDPGLRDNFFARSRPQA
jgi:hypothetical protein